MARNRCAMQGCNRAGIHPYGPDPLMVYCLSCFRFRFSRAPWEQPDPNRVVASNIRVGKPREVVVPMDDVIDSHDVMPGFRARVFRPTGHGKALRPNIPAWVGVTR